VLQKGQLERVDDSQTRPVDVRIIAATNQDLKAEVENKHFREDLYFRPNVFPIEAVPLKKCSDDIPLLAQHFITLISRKLNRPEPKLNLANVKQLQAYSWPGNTRELQSVIERAIIIICQNNELTFNLPNTKPDGPILNSIDSQNDNQQMIKEVLSEQQPYSENERFERDRSNIQLALTACKGKISGENGAAQLLGIKPTTLASRIKKSGWKTLKPIIFFKKIIGSISTHKRRLHPM